jgi:hypothetical protein
MTTALAGKERAMAKSQADLSSTNGGTRRDASIAEPVRSLLSDVSLLVRREAELATVEMKAKASKMGVAAAFLGAGAVVAILAAAALVAAAVLALAIVLPAWAAALIVGLLVLALAAVLLAIGRARLRAAGPLAPTETLDAVREDIGWMRHETERLNATE